VRSQTMLLFALMSLADRKDRFRDRKQPYAHFKPVSLVFSVTKVALIRVIVHSSSKEHFHVPEKSSARAQLLLSELGPGFIKDILITSTARGYEYAAVKYLTPKRAGQLMRGSWLGVHSSRDCLILN
jgi:hypothetical protein